MKEIELKNLKGTTDFPPEEQALRNKIIDNLKRTFEKYGYMPLETPMLNSFDLLKYKYEDDAEILNEVYKMKDQGDRDIGLRFDLTVPFCKFIGLNHDLIMPFRRYEIGKVFRDGPVKLGRSREFYQCDVDVVGLDGRYIEIEQMQMVVNVFNSLGIDIVIKWNNRKLMSGLISSLGISEDKIADTIALIDRLEKISKQELDYEFEKIGINSNKVDELLKLFSLSLDEYTKKYSNTNNELLKQGLTECQDIANLIKELHLENNTQFSPTLARGLSIYTGTIFEFFDKQKRITSSLGGGGRYDKIITDFMNNGMSYPACGLTFGLEPIYAILKNDNKEQFIDVLIIPMGTEIKCLEIANKLRDVNANVVTDLTGKKIKKSFEYANKLNIKYVMVIGENEINSNKYSLKDMEKGEQIEVDEVTLINTIKNYKLKK